ncbi:hypothetical protein [Hymenobacter sp. DG01]|uniref:hypothetical protein n=1 Tax=Hymenobacter sp. DG01 TaxID=2584940 RepID=UPI001122FCEF|nr:hypothetical protein [Hymenobacter sp. DG01]
MTALLGGVSVGSAKAETSIKSTAPLNKLENTSVELHTLEAARLIFQARTYHLIACGHNETLYAATKEAAKEYMAWMIEAYC